MNWTLDVPLAHLSDYQRLVSIISIFVAGDEFEKRDDPGQMVVFIQVRDHDNRTYRSHRTLNLKEKTDPEDLARLRIFERICLVPGNYEVAAALYDTKSKEHNSKKVELSVPKLRHDPLPDVWLNRPAVELSRFCNSRDSTRLSLVARTVKSTRVEVVVNRPADPFAALALPSRLDVISEMQLLNGSMGVTALDLHSEKVRTQEIESKVDLRRLWTGFPRNTRRVVDVRALENGNEAAQFFVSQIRKLVEAPISQQQRVLIILSAPTKFPKDADLSPIQLKRPASTHVFYIRCNTIHGGPGPSGFFMPSGPSGESIPIPSLPPPALPAPHHVPSNSDSLERTLKPLDPELFDVWTAIQFRRALGAIMKEISDAR